MATSGSTTFELQRDQIINAALRKLSVFGDGQSPSATQVTNAAQALNAMLKSFQTDGMPLWAIKEYTFSITASTETYQIGSGKTLNTPVPLKILQAFLVNNVSGNKIPMNISTHYDYNNISISSTTGMPIHLMYEPLNGYGNINLWPVPDSNAATTYSINILYQRPFEEFNGATDTPDFPSYWTEALIYGLAWRLSAEYGVPINDRSLLAKEAEVFHAQALGFGTEEGSIKFQPHWG